MSNGAEAEACCQQLKQIENYSPNLLDWFMHEDCFNNCRINYALSYTCMSYESLFYLKIINSLFLIESKSNIPNVKSRFQ